MTYVGLNVGGKIYTTSRTTLTSDQECFFARMLDETIPSARDEHGNYMIDRDGEIFRHVLNFMRSGKLLLPEGFRELSLLECEADFYQLSALQESIRQLKDADDIIGLNVGGRIFKTTRETLAQAPGSRFAAILSGEAPLPPRDEHGNYIFDRSSEMFSYVLEFLRCGHLALPCLPWRSSGCDKLLADEAEFFRMPRLLAHIKSLREITAEYNNDNYIYKTLVVYHDNSTDRYTAYGSHSHLWNCFNFLTHSDTKNSISMRDVFFLGMLPDGADSATARAGALSFQAGSVDFSSNRAFENERHIDLTDVSQLVSHINGKMTRRGRKPPTTSDKHVDTHCVQYKFKGSPYH